MTANSGRKTHLREVCIRASRSPAVYPGASTPSIVNVETLSCSSFGRRMTSESSRRFFCKALYHVLVRLWSYIWSRSLEAGFFFSLWGLDGNAPRTMKHYWPGWCCEVSIWVGKMLCSAGLVISPASPLRFVRGKPRTFLLSLQFRTPLCKLTEDFMVRMVPGKVFDLQASSVCSKELPLLSKVEQYVFFCLRDVMWVVV